MRSRPDPTAGPEGPLTLAFPGDMRSVRRVLLHLLTATPLRTLSDADRGTTELVLAEVLNNIVEHAYAGGNGQIALSLGLSSAGLAVRISDNGLAMPGGAVPAGLLPTDPDGPAATLPEGGFGWFLIRSLTRDLCYDRKDGQNHLSFTLPIG
ncbi:ATP-binding protein [Tabrizicola sp. BL-A-41-H6]|uniref:ATP-binding protein n=1 Tax=Tabrizicola sp. BL-A-41-H6 TaxID=3421107 RepID=UPI003D669055